MGNPWPYLPDPPPRTFQASTVDGGLPPAEVPSPEWIPYNNIYFLFS